MDNDKNKKIILVLVILTVISRASGLSKEKIEEIAKEK